MSVYENDLSTHLVIARSGTRPRSLAQWMQDVQALPAGHFYTWDTGTANADPGAGKIRANNATLSSATALYISEADNLGNSLAAIIATWDDSTSTSKGQLLIRKVSAPSNFVQFVVSGAVTDSGAYDAIAVTYVAGAGSFAASDSLTVQFVATGDKGSSGAGSGDLVSTNNLSDVANAATARTNLGLAIGVNVQAFDTQLATLAATTPSSGDIHYWTSSSAVSAISSTTAGRTILTYVDPNVDAITFWDDSAGAFAGLALPSAMSISTTNLLLDETWTIPVSDETTTITTGTAKITWVFPYNVTVVSVGASVNTVSSSGTPTFDINEAGVSILSTKITIDASEKTSLTAATAPVISDSSIAAGAEMSVDIDVSGTGVKGAKVWLIVRRTS